ncbi:FecCD family ABC transporter permease [Nocardioides sambongensis]|uniref:FecCD family ABC transporter permease n=1 Tax=Nocardioides sambongensis TaxID=2589074 RepID=UPI0011297D49|nr:iron chelate uptake ABC transporter family permease subunit [Nocardioides sambongensis]
MQALQAPGVSAPPVTSVGRSQRTLVLVGSVVLLVVVLIASLALGVRDVAPSEVWRALVDPVAGNVDHDVVRDQRIPRTVIGLLAGIGLGLAGVLAQAITRNPLGDPGLLGLNAGASVGIVIAAVWFGITSPVAAVWFAFAGVALAAIVVFAIGHGRPVQLALAGATVTALLTPLSTLFLFQDVNALNLLRFWSVGSLVGRELDTAQALWPFLAFGMVVAALVSHRLNGLALGDDVATALGQGVGVTRAWSGLAIIALAGTATALAGPIALVGLVVPHAARRLVGTDYRWIVPVCAVLGPVMLVTADVVGRLVKSDELEAGVVAALIGAPVLIAVARSPRVAGL